MKRFWIPVLLAVFVAGCGGGADVVGKYKMTATIPADDPAAQMAAKLMESMTLDLKADKNTPKEAKFVRI